MNARMRVTALLVLAMSALGFSPASAQPNSSPEQVWGAASDGMRMSIAAVKSGSTTQGDAEFYVAFQNVGSKDMVLNLGFVLANGKVAEPSSVRLALTDPKGQRAEFPWLKTQIILGRIDDFIVVLPAGATYILKLKLDEYCCRSPVLKLIRGHYRIAARFQGKGAQHVNLDTPGVRLLNFWVGAVESNSLEFDLAALVQAAFPGHVTAGVVVRRFRS